MAESNNTYVSQDNLKLFFDNIYKKENVEQIEGNSFSIFPNREYNLGTINTKLTLDFVIKPHTNFSSEYIISFTTGEGGSVENDTIVWAGGIEPQWFAGATYLMCFIPIGNYMLGTWVAIKEE